MEAGLSSFAGVAEEASLPDDESDPPNPIQLEVQSESISMKKKRNDLGQANSLRDPDLQILAVIVDSWVGFVKFREEGSIREELVAGVSRDSLGECGLCDGDTY